MKYILFAILFYLAFQFIFRLVLPVYRATSQIKKGFNDMESRMQEKMNEQEKNNPSRPPAAEKQKTPKGEYIDFEEV